MRIIKDVEKKDCVRAILGKVGRKLRTLWKYFAAEDPRKRLCRYRYPGSLPYHYME